MLPTFIIAGAAKSGTTAIHEILDTHPEVCMSWMKGPTYFTREVPRARYHKGLDWYESLFKGCGEAKADPNALNCSGCFGNEDNSCLLCR